MVKKYQKVGPGGKKGKIKDLKLRKDTVKTLTREATKSVKGGVLEAGVSRNSCLKCTLN
jgi:hypothetical protein